MDPPAHSFIGQPKLTLRVCSGPPAEHLPRDAPAEQDPEGDPKEPGEEVHRAVRGDRRGQGQLQGTWDDSASTGETHRRSGGVAAKIFKSFPRTGRVMAVVI